MDRLRAEIQSCKICKDLLPHPPRPVISVSEKSKILLIGQAPGKKVHESGIPWDDRSGELLRDWLGMSKNVFYDSGQVAIVPMGFCYPGKGTTGDLPPRPECFEAWHRRVLGSLKNIELTLLIGKYAQDAYLKAESKKTLTENVKSYQAFLPHFIPLPHPSPRNRFWMSKNPWFNREVIPLLREKVHSTLN